jgi:UDP-3-O-[3-hydroxymyristoyl] N-acetylglucosamine deacetylase
MRSRALFTGLLTGVRILPAPPGLRGIHFRRADLPAPAGDVLILAHVSRVVAPAEIGLPALPGRCTIVGDRAARVGVATVEHVLSALAGLGVRDALVEVDGPEVPIFDGSARPFVEMIMATADAEPRSRGVTQSRGEGDAAPTHTSQRDDRPRAPGSASNAECRMPDAVPASTGDWLLPTASLSVSDASGARIDITPCAPHDTPIYAYTLDYSGHPDPRVRGALPARTAACPAPHASPAARDFYAARVAPARTFCLASEARAMQQAGLFAGLTPRDMLVLDDGTGEPIDNAFRPGLADGALARQPDGSPPFEPAAHKLLDLIGDLALLGAPLHAHVHAFRGGHALTHEACRAVLAALAGVRRVARP